MPPSRQSSSTREAFDGRRPLRRLFRLQFDDQLGTPPLDWAGSVRLSDTVSDLPTPDPHTVLLGRSGWMRLNLSGWMRLNGSVALGRALSGTVLVKGRDHAHMCRIVGSAGPSGAGRTDLLLAPVSARPADAEFPHGFTGEAYCPALPGSGDRIQSVRLDRVSGTFDVRSDRSPGDLVGPIRKDGLVLGRGLGEDVLTLRSKPSGLGFVAPAHSRFFRRRDFVRFCAFAWDSSWPDPGEDDWRWRRTIREFRLDEGDPVIVRTSDGAIRSGRFRLKTAREPHAGVACEDRFVPAGEVEQFIPIGTVAGPPDRPTVEPTAHPAWRRCDTDPPSGKRDVVVMRFRYRSRPDHPRTLDFDFVYHCDGRYQYEGSRTELRYKPDRWANPHALFA